MRTPRRLVACFLLLMICLSIKAIPNYGIYTDGWRHYDVRGSFDSQLSLFTYASAEGEKGYYFSLTSIASDVFLVDSLHSKELSLPSFVNPCDTVLAPGNGGVGLFFVNSKGRLFASMKHLKGDDDPMMVRRCDSLSILFGEYDFAGDKIMIFSLNDEREPILINDCDGTERITFCKEVVHNGQALMHIKTPRRRWLIEVTPTGLNIYSAVWNKAKGQYQRGQLLRRAKLSKNRATLFAESYTGFPFIDILDKFYSKTVCRSVIAEMEESQDFYCREVFLPLLKRLEAQKTR